MDRIKTIHNLLFKDTDKDYTFMCFELLMLVFSVLSVKNTPFSIKDDDPSDLIANPNPYVLDISEDNIPLVLKNFFLKYWNGGNVSYMGGSKHYYYFNKSSLSLPELLILYTEKVYGRILSLPMEAPEDMQDLDEYQANVKDFKEVKRWLEMMN